MRVGRGPYYWPGSICSTVAKGHHAIAVKRRINGMGSPSGSLPSKGLIKVFGEDSVHTNRIFGLTLVFGVFAYDHRLLYEFCSWERGYCLKFSSLAVLTGYCGDTDESDK
jgi:hypothetical protein